MDQHPVQGEKKYSLPLHATETGISSSSYEPVLALRLHTLICLPEFLPYRRVDWTAQRDEKTHSYFCSHGYVCVRVDMRGSGDSEGFIHDECERQEHEDCCDVISWISQQNWCTGDVGKLILRNVSLALNSV